MPFLGGKTGFFLLKTKKGKEAKKKKHKKENKQKKNKEGGFRAK